MPNDCAIVPFVKYQGQPVETLLADQNYLQWVTSQPGLMAMLQARHPAVFNIITIGAPTTDDTPEHNKLQALFLEADFQCAFIEIVLGKSVYVIAQEAAIAAIELKPHIGDDFPAVLRQMKRNGATVLVIGSFESISCTLEQVQGIFGERKIITLAQIQAIKTRGVWPPTNN